MTDQAGSNRPDLSALRIDEGARGEAGTGRGTRIGLIAAGIVLAAAVAVGIVWTKSRSVAVGVALARSATSGDQDAAVLVASGYVTPRRRATVAAKITGRVSEMLVEEGMGVEEGQVLARLDDADARAALEAARAERTVALSTIAEMEVNLADAERTFKRTQELGRAGVASAQERDRAQAAVDGLRARIALARDQVKSAETRIAMARQDLENCTVRSPFAGIAVSKDAQPGEIVSPISAGGGFTRTGISTIVDMDSLEIEVDVNESYIAKVAPGQRVIATLDAYPDWQIPAKVRTIIPTADRQKATVKVRIAFDRLDPRILPDMGIKVSFLEEPKPGREEAGGASEAAARVLVPKQSVRDMDGKKVAFVLKDGKLERRAVRIGGTRGSDVEILAGVSVGESVVTEGPASLRDGERAEAKR